MVVACLHVSDCSLSVSSWLTPLSRSGDRVVQGNRRCCFSAAIKNCSSKVATQIPAYGHVVCTVALAPPYNACHPDAQCCQHAVQNCATHFLFRLLHPVCRSTLQCSAAIMATRFSFPSQGRACLQEWLPSCTGAPPQQLQQT